MSGVQNQLFLDHQMLQPNPLNFLFATDGALGRVFLTSGTATHCQTPEGLAMEDSGLLVGGAAGPVGRVTGYHQFLSRYLHTHCFSWTRRSLCCSRHVGH